MVCDQHRRQHTGVTLMFRDLFLRERERESKHKWGQREKEREREKDTESEAGSRFQAGSTEPDVGLELTNLEIVT